MELRSHCSNTSARDGTTARGTERSLLLVIVLFTERLPLRFEELSTLEGTTASLADKARRMPGSIESSDEVLLDRLIASIAFGSEETEEVIAAVRTTILLVESILSKFPSALVASKVFHVEVLSESSYASIGDGSIASPTSRREHLVIVILTVSLSTPLEEVSVSEFLTAFTASEMFRMPHLAKSDHYLSNNWLAAESTVSLWNSVHSMLGRKSVRVQRSQHRIRTERITRRRATQIIVRRTVVDASPRGTSLLIDVISV